MPRPNRVPEKAKDFKSAIKRLLNELKPYKIAIFLSLLLAISGSIISIITPGKLSNLTDEISEGLIPNKNNIEKIKTSVMDKLINFDVKSVLDSDLTDEEKQTVLSTLQKINKDNASFLLTQMDSKLVDAVLKDIEIDGKKIKTVDALNFFNDIVKKEDLYSAVESSTDSIKTLVEPVINMDKIKIIALTLLILYILSSIFNYIESIIMTIVSNKFAKKLRNNISLKINKLPLKYFDRNQTGDILSRITNDVDTIAQSMNQSLATLVSSLTLFIGTIIMMFATNYIMALTAILSSMLGFVFMFKILSKSQVYFKERQRSLGDLNSHIEEVYSSLLVVKAYNGKKESDEKFDLYNNRVYDASRKSQFLSGIMPPLMMFIGNLGYVAVCIVGAILTEQNIITFGVIVAFITYVRLFTSPLSQIGQAVNTLQSTLASSERVFEFLDEDEMEKENNKKVLNKDTVKGNIIFEHVKFGYDEDKVIIKDFSVSVKKGEKVAIVGPTGAGKTTIVNLLMKFYNINSGDIKIDGVSIKDLKRENIHNLFTMVLQDTWVFKGTIRENIMYNRKNVTDEEIMRVCDVVGLSHFIKTLPKGLDTDISENDSVSSGQRQLLTIARGMIEDSPFLILDEATSNVDTRTEELVSRAMDKLSSGKTSFIIAHRLSTIRNADKILVMKDGDVVETGNHDELIKKNGFYAELYNSQFEL